MTRARLHNDHVTSRLFLLLALLLAAPLRADDPATGDTISLRAGAYGTITLKEGQTLAGEQGTKIERIVLASDSTVRGVSAEQVSGRELRGRVTLQNVEASTLSLLTQLGAFRWSGGSGAAIDLDGGNGEVTIENVTIRQESGTAVRVANRSGGSVAFGQGSTITVAAGKAEGIVLNANAGSVSFAAPVTISTTGARAMTVKSCDAVTMAGGTLTASGASALQITATARLAISLDRVESSGADNGVVLDHTGGTATLRGVRVTKSGSAILLRDASGVRLEGVTIEGAARYGVEAERVDGLVLSDGELRGCGLAFRDARGDLAIIRTKVLEPPARDLYLVSGGGEGSLLIDGSTFRGGRGPNAAQGALFELRGNAKLAVRIEDSTFADHFSNAIHVGASETAAADVIVRGCTFRGNNAAVVLHATGDSALRYRIAANREISGHSSTPIVVNGSSKHEVSGTVEENVIRADKPGSNGVSLTAGGSGPFFATVRGNTISSVAGSGISASAGGSGDVRLAITGNTIRDPLSSPTARALAGQL